MKSIKRAIRKWLDIGDSAYPPRFVAVTSWRDGILAVASNGDLYKLEYDYMGHVVTRLLLCNPVKDNSGV